jgi:putative nucleotidyltransferase with HDIG domain
LKQANHHTERRLEYNRRRRSPALQSALVVDDELAIRDLLTQWLDRLGFSVVSAGSAVEAVGLLTSHRFDLILTDLKMPVLDGMSLLRLLNEFHQRPATIVITGYGDIHSAVEAMKLGAADFILKPFGLEQLEMAVHNALAANGLRRSRPRRDTREVVLGPAIEDLLLKVQSGTLSEPLLEALVTALDAREAETGAHSKRTGHLAVVLGQSLGLDQEALVELRRGALLHDIGKIGVSDHILLKAGPLSDQEWDEMRMHPEIGARIASKLESLRPAAELILTHHERYDGTGYPRGLKGEEIPLSARIFAIADSVDAMLCPRPYRSAMDLPAVLEEVAARSGSQFDPVVCEHFLALSPDQWWTLYDPANSTDSTAEPRS